MSNYVLTRRSFVCACLLLMSTIVTAEPIGLKECYPTLAQYAANETVEKPLKGKKKYAQAPDFKNNDIIIDADHVSMEKANQATFAGNVEIQAGNSAILADKATVNNSDKTLVAEGQIEFKHPNVTVKGHSFDADLTNSAISLKQTQYTLAGHRGHGKAEGLFIQQGERSVVLTEATFTSCPEDQAPDWQLNADEIILSVDGEWGEAWHNRIDVMDVPVIYLPYISFPLTDKRRSGFLMPKIDSSKSKGLDITLPYYFDLAPNYDATLHPRYMSRRGVQLGSEFRYLADKGKASVYSEYLNEDDDFPNDDSRYAFKLKYRGEAWGHWKSNIDINQVSDDGYLSDFGFRGFSKVDTHIESLVSFYQHHKDWFVEVNFRHFEAFGETLKPYRVLPEVVAEYSPDLGYENFTFFLPAEAAYFDTNESFRQNAFRLHTEPTFKLHWTEPAWEIAAETSLLATAYRQEGAGLVDDTTSNTPTYLSDESETITRMMPRLRLNGRMILERPMSWFGKAMTQTLEPRAQYLWIPYRDQSDIGVYDTSILQDDYYGLFRNNRFSGLDRIMESDQVTLGITTRLLNKNNDEKLQFSIGQIFYLDNTKLDLVGAELEVERGESALAADLNFDIRDTWFFHHGLQYDTDLSVTRKSYTRLDYKFDEEHIVQMSHRFARDISGSTISMAGIAGRWHLGEKWQLFGSFQHDLQYSRELESRVGFIYQSCCWSMQVAYESHIETDLIDSNGNTDEVNHNTDSGVMIRFSLGRIGQSATGRYNVLEQGIFGYRRPYFLNQ